MAQLLTRLLDAKEPHGSLLVRELERMTGNKGIDVRYLADNTARAHQIMRRMGLDPADTTSLELYRTLVAHKDSATLFKDSDDVGLTYPEGIISFNQQDILANANKTFEKRTMKHMRCQMQHALSARYAETEKIDEETIEKLYKEAGLGMCKLTEYHDQKIEQQLGNAAGKPRVICVGDIFTDTFIALDENEASVETDKEGRDWLKIPFGSKPPYQEAEVVSAVGPSPNAAVAMARLGLDVELLSWLGGDQVGKDSLAYLAREHVGTTMMSVNKHQASSSYYVLRYGADRTILVKDEDYDYKWKAPSRVPDWVYLSHISKNSWRLHQELMDYLEEHPQVKLAFQPGTFHFKWGAKKLAKVYKRAHIVVMNREEAADVTGESTKSVKNLALALHELGPEIVVITDGPNGSFAWYEGTLYQIPNYPDPAPPLDRTGAGDAFASTIVSALALGQTIEEALVWAPINSMSVVQKLGAQAGLLHKKELLKYLENAPEWYKTEERT